MKKKILCTILALALGFALAGPAMASEPVWTTLPADAEGHYTFNEDIGWIQFYNSDTDEISYIIPATGTVLPYIAAVRNGYAVIGTTGPYGLMAGNGAQILLAKYGMFSREDGSFLKNGLICARDAATGTYGLYNSAGQALAEGAVRVTEVSSQLAAVSTGAGVYLVNGAGVRVGGVYGSVAESFSEGLFRVTLQGSDMYIDGSGNTVLVPGAQDCGDFHNGLARAARGGKYGYINTNGTFVIPPMFNAASDFSRGLAQVTLEDGTAALINVNGTTLLTGAYSELTPLSDTLVKAVDMTGLCGVFSTVTGSFVVPLAFGDAEIVTDGLLAASVTDPASGAAKYAVYTVGGFPLSQPEFDMVTTLAPGLVEVTKYVGLEDPCTGVIGATGQIFAPTEGLSLTAADGMLIASSTLSGSSFGVFDLAGKSVIPMKYESVISTGSGFICASAPGVTDIGPDGNVVVSTSATLFGIDGEQLSGDYNTIDRFSEGLARVSMGANYGFIDRSGQEVIPVMYAEASAFSDGVAVARTFDNKWGVIDKSNVFTQFNGTYTEIGSYLGGVAVATNGDGLCGLLDAAGNTVLEFDYTSIACADTFGRWFILTDPNGVRWVYKNDLAGETNFIDVDQEWMEAPVEYVYSHGQLMKGTDPITFDPKGKVDLGTTLTVIARILGQETATLPGENWYDVGWKWGARMGFTSGKTPTSPVSRQELVYMLWSSLRSGDTPGEQAAMYDDYGQVYESYRDAVNWAVGENILRGKDGNKLDPSGSLTRAELAAFLQRTCQSQLQ